MQDFPLSITAILRHGASVYRDSECVTWTGTSARPANYAQVATNAERHAAALTPLVLRQGDRPILRYHELIAAEEPGFAWPEIDERAAAAMCYTSGTTGDPKGVVYSHRSTFLHAQALLSASISGVTEADRVLAIVPMFHVNAWGLPYGSFLGGASLLMPGPFLQPEPIARFVHEEKATVVSAVPTIWQAVLSYGENHDIDLSTLRTGTSGGAAAPRSLFEKFEQRYGLRIIQGWGMTETSPLGGMAWPPPGVEEGTTEDMDWRMKSG